MGRERGAHLRRVPRPADPRTAPDATPLPEPRCTVPLPRHRPPGGSAAPVIRRVLKELRNPPRTQGRDQDNPSGAQEEKGTPEKTDPEPTAKAASGKSWWCDSRWPGIVLTKIDGTPAKYFLEGHSKPLFYQEPTDLTPDGQWFADAKMTTKIDDLSNPSAHLKKPIKSNSSQPRQIHLDKKLKMSEYHRADAKQKIQLLEENQAYLKENNLGVEGTMAAPTNKPGPKLGLYFRYHKFPQGQHGVVLGGGLNKSELQEAERSVKKTNNSPSGRTPVTGMDDEKKLNEDKFQDLPELIDLPEPTAPKDKEPKKDKEPEPWTMPLVEESKTSKPTPDLDSGNSSKLPAKKESDLPDEMIALLRARQKLMHRIHTLGPDSDEKAAQVQKEAWQEFQANAMTTPFIATTTDLKYAIELFTDPTYAPKEGQDGTILAICGPADLTFDFEAEFGKLGAKGGGSAATKFRTEEKRAKDAGQSEVGLPDLYIPVDLAADQGKPRSPLGFWVEDMVTSPQDAHGLSRLQQLQEQVDEHNRKVQ